MTPTEKAKELVQKFSTQLPYYSQKDNINKSKICAIICVDEIIKEFNYNSKQDEKQGYWQEVKQEIEKL